MGCFRNVAAAFCAVWVLIFGMPLLACAADTEDFLQMDELGFEEVEESLSGLSAGNTVSFSDTVRALIRGEIPVTAENLKDLAFRALFSEMQNQKATAIQVLLLVIAAAVIMNFTDIMEKNKTAGVGFYVMYLLLFTLLMKAFYGMSQMLENSLSHVLGFMKVLVPSYFAASVFASGSISGAAFYEFTFLLLGVIQWLLRYALLPAVELYVMFQMLNHLSRDERLSRLAELMRTLTEWTLKTLVAGAIGLQAVQSLILPAVDTLRATVANKAVSSVPGIGNLFGGVTDMVLGSAVLVKNAIGVSGMIVIALICMAPVCRLAVCALLYRVIAAFIQPVSDKRLNACVAAVSEGAGLLLRIMAAMGLLLFLTVAMVTASIGG